MKFALLYFLLPGLTNYEVRYESTGGFARIRGTSTAFDIHLCFDDATTVSGWRRHCPRKEWAHDGIDFTWIAPAPDGGIDHLQGLHIDAPIPGRRFRW